MNKSKPETRRYDLRTKDDRRWLGTILITHDGLVACNTDYGSYSYWWTSTGCDDLRRFLVKIDTGYLLGKFSPRDEYDGDATEKAIREMITSERRRGRLDKDEAREEYDRTFEHDLTSEIGFWDWARETKIGDAWELACHRTNPQAVAFAEEVWPVFVDVLRAEMAAEQGKEIGA